MAKHRGSKEGKRLLALQSCAHRGPMPLPIAPPAQTLPPLADVAPDIAVDSSPEEAAEAAGVTENGAMKETPIPEEEESKAFPTVAAAQSPQQDKGTMRTAASAPLEDELPCLLESGKTAGDVGSHGHPFEDDGDGQLEMIGKLSLLFCLCEGRGMGWCGWAGWEGLQAGWVGWAERNDIWAWLRGA